METFTTSPGGQIVPVPEGGSQAFSACTFHCLNQWRVAVRTHFQKKQVFRSEQLGSSNQYMKNPSVELLQESKRVPLSCWEDFVFVPFPKTTSFVALRPPLTTPEVSFDDTTLSSYHRIQAQWTAGQCRLSSQGAGRCARVLQTRTHQVDNSSPPQQEVNRFQNQQRQSFQQQFASHQDFRQRRAQNNLLEPT